MKNYFNRSNLRKMNLKKAQSSQKFPRTMTAKVMKTWARMKNLEKIGVIWSVKQLKRTASVKAVASNQQHHPSIRA